MNFEKLREPPQRNVSGVTPVGDQGSHLLHIPDVVLVCEAFHRFTSFRIAPVSQLAVAMNGVVAAAL